MPYKNHYPCSVDDCKKPRRNKGMCAAHAKRIKIHGDPHKVLPRGNFAKQPICAIEDCNKKHTALGFCQSHYRDFVTFCDKHKNSIDWSSYGERQDKGYKELYRPNHPWCSKKGYVKEHRLVMESVIGRHLQPHETVHHKNGNRRDNRPENLELWSVRQPKGQRVEDKVKYAIEILEQYAPELLSTEKA